MTDIAIRVENLSKRYRIVAVQNRHDTLREAIVDTFQRFTFQRSNVQRSDDSYIWALKDVSFLEPETCPEPGEGSAGGREPVLSEAKDAGGGRCGVSEEVCGEDGSGAKKGPAGNRLTSLA